MSGGTNSDSPKQSEAAHRREQELERVLERTREAEATVERLKASLHTIRDLNRAIFQERTRDGLLRRTCEIVTAGGQYEAAWIVLVNPDGSLQTSALAGAAVFGQAFRQVPACARAALRRGSTLEIASGEATCAGCDLRARDVVTYCLPLAHHGAAFGVLGVTVRADATVPLDEKELLQDAARDVAGSLRKLEAEEARARSDAALRESEERFRLLADNIPGVIYLCLNDSRHTMLYLNNAVEALTGYAKKDFLTDHVSFKDLFHPDDAAMIPRVINEAVQQRDTYHLTYRIRHRSGEWRWVEEFGSGVFDGGELRYLEGFIHDFTARKRAEEELKRLATAVEQADESFVVTGASWNIEYVNSAFTRVTGYTRSECLGLNLRDIAGGVGETSEQGEVWEHLARGETWQGHLTQRKKDGSLFEEEATISPVRDHHGAVVNYVAVKRDVTTEMRLSEQLRQAQKLESVGRLAGGVAHDFNNLLTPIIGYAELGLLAIPTDQPLYGYLQQIRNAAKHARALTQQLLAFSRKQVLRMQCLNLNNLITESEDMLRRVTREDVNIQVHLAPDLGTIRGDGSQVQQILMNLVVNGSDAMPTGGLLTIESENVQVDDVHATAHPGLQPGNYVRLSVSDTGRGMDAETLKQIFEPFFTTKGVGKGTGLGLATVHGIVRQHGAQIFAYSEPNRGSCLRLYFPRVDQSADADEAAPMEGRARGGETILVAEDEASVRKLTCEILERHGYRVLVADHAAAALALAGEHADPIHLLLTDVIMPNMSGRELHQRLRESRPGIRVLYMSGYTYDMIAHHGVLDPEVNFLQKPFSMHALTRKVREALEGPINTCT